jgi:hypothetical protein
MASRVIDIYRLRFLEVWGFLYWVGTGRFRD